MLEVLDFQIPKYLKEKKKKAINIVIFMQISLLCVD